MIRWTSGYNARVSARLRYYTRSASAATATTAATAATAVTADVQGESWRQRLMGAMWLLAFLAYTACVALWLPPLVLYYSAVTDDGDYANDWLTHLPTLIRPAIRGSGILLAWALGT